MVVIELDVSRDGFFELFGGLPNLAVVHLIFHTAEKSVGHRIGEEKCASKYQHHPPVPSDYPQEPAPKRSPSEARESEYEERGPQPLVGGVLFSLIPLGCVISLDNVKAPSGATTTA